MYAAFLFAAAFALGSSEQAEAARASSEEECGRRFPTGASSVQIAACTSDLSGSERAVEGAYAALRMRVPDEQRAALERAQDAWRKHRDAQCAWEAGGTAGSTGHSSAIIACTADMNRRRAAYLRSDLKERW